jgi:hypothetical protein
VPFPFSVFSFFEFQPKTDSSPTVRNFSQGVLTVAQEHFAKRKVGFIFAPVY